MQKLLILFSFCIVLAFAQRPDPQKWRRIDGKNTNPNHPTWGSTGIQLRRKTPAVYGDGISAERKSVTGAPLASARRISNELFRKPIGDMPLSKRGLTDFTTYWGQFLDHDLDLTGGPLGSANPPQLMPIPVPGGDPFFDPLNTGTKFLPMYRSIYDPNTGVNTPREHINLVTAWHDASQVYGSSDDVADALRSHTAGLLKSQMIGGSEYPPYVPPGIVIENHGPLNDSELFFVGDVRGNENPGLLTLHILFLREHNRRARQLFVKFPTWTDEELYQEARRWVIAVMQHITEEEYFPVILGSAPPEDSAWNSTLDPSIYSEFSSAAFRYGHSEVNEYLWRLDAGLHSIGDLQLRSTYYNPGLIVSGGIEPLIRGMASQTQGRVDTHFIDDLRNYLFGAPGSGGLDLTALNTQRARDHGIPGINDFRASYGLYRYTSWSQINPDATIISILEGLYASIDDCDVYVCGLAESEGVLSNVGETFATAIFEQYIRVRDGDKLWYEAPNYFTDDELRELEHTTLADVILRNTNIQSTEIQCMVMSQGDGCGKPVSPVVNGAKYDFFVTITKKTSAHPFLSKGHQYGFSINGVEGATLTLARGKSYKFFVQGACSHVFGFTESEEEVGDAYDGALNNWACLSQENPVVTLTVEDDTPTTLYYMCGFHAWMGGMIVIPKEEEPATSTTAPEQVVQNDNKVASAIAASVLITFALTVVAFFVVVVIHRRMKARKVFAPASSRQSRADGEQVNLE